ncbi:MAG: hypothetical protein OXH06_17065 [Gemmatimonadetes bacterium]|nr:hypothetical protein [Gemmatimonadota bacterium]
MDVDQVRELVEDAFPELVSSRRNNPDGWAFFYQRIERGRRIARVLGFNSGVEFKFAVSDRINEHEGSTVMINGQEEKLCGWIRKEIALWIVNFGD